MKGTTNMKSVLTRDEHIAWCKRRALDYLDRDDVEDGVRLAITSLLSDLNKHPETKPSGKSWGLLGLSVAMENDTARAREFIEGVK